MASPPPVLNYTPKLTLTEFAQFVLPEMGAHALLTLLFLISGQWISFALNLPLLAFNINKYAPLLSS